MSGKPRTVRPLDRTSRGGVVELHPKRGPELAHELLSLLVIVLSRGGIREEIALSAAKSALSEVLAKFGGNRVWFPRLREVNGRLSWFELDETDDQIAMACRTSDLSEVGREFGLTEDAVRAVAARVAIEERAARQAGVSVEHVIGREFRGDSRNGKRARRRR
ncbi:MAG: hypothetical protein GC151_13670 [Betaproteobacteria bacterium]|nr:hypothetical protein [Betaproteobacteria bacterium]